MATQNINIQPSTAELADLGNLWMKQVKLDLNCHNVGTIESFDPVFQTAKVSINYTKAYLKIDDVGNANVLPDVYPVLVDCPCIVVGGGSGYLSFPIEPGDECLVMFNDRDMDNWYSGSSNSITATGRLHAFTDAIVLVGLRSRANAIMGYDGEAVTLSYKGNKFKLAEDKLTVDLTPAPSSGVITFEYTSEGKLAIKNATAEFVAALVKLFDDVNTATAGGFPVLMPTYAVDILALKSFQE